MCRLWKWLRKRNRMNKSNGDVRVIGAVGGIHIIEDIARDVPYRGMVIIPAEQALRSKDLWRAISQGFLLQVPSAPYPVAPGVPVSDHERARLENYVAELEAHVLRLQNESEAFKRQIEGSTQSQSAKLDEILKAIQSGMPMPPQAQASGAPVRPAYEETVDGTAPTFLPSEIKPKDLDARINIQAEESTSGSVSEATDRLRQMRKKDRNA
jgi:hypothetical protein